MLNDDIPWGGTGLKAMALSPAMFLNESWQNTELQLDASKLFYRPVHFRLVLVTSEKEPCVRNHGLYSALYHQEGTSGQNLVSSSLGQEAHQSPCIRMQPGVNGQRHNIPTGTETHLNCC